MNHITSSMLDVSTTALEDESIVNFEYHSYTPFTNNFEQNQEIRIQQNQQDIFTFISDSFLNIEGVFLRDDGTPTTTALLTNNSVLYLFEEIRLLMNSIQIDQNKNPGVTSTLKGYASYSPEKSKKLSSAGWHPFDTLKVNNKGKFNFCVPLSCLFGFAEDVKCLILNSKMELVLIRSNHDENSYYTTDAGETMQITIEKISWKIPHVTPSDREKLKLNHLVHKDTPLPLYYRSWGLYTFPELPITSHTIWSVCTSSAVEKPRYVIFALQTNRNNEKTRNNSEFDPCNVTDVKLYLNSVAYPYDNYNLNINDDVYALLYQNYANFQKSYYNEEAKPLLDMAAYKSRMIHVFDTSRQNDSLKQGSVDIKLEIRTSANIAAKTSAYCLLLHDRKIEYKPLSNVVQILV